MKLVVGSPTRILDVGCGAGLLGQQLRDAFPDSYTVGVESDPERARLARARFTQVFEAGIEDEGLLSLLAGDAPFDLIVCADVLEHLVAPAAVLKNLAGMLTRDGQLITSLPNVRHVSTFVDLYLFGRWPQRDRGIHDRTHLHFFARSNILELGQESGLRVEVERRNLRLLEALPWTMVPAKLLDFWPVRGLFTFQYLHSWRLSRD